MHSMARPMALWEELGYGAPTLIGSSGALAAIEARDRYYGCLIGVSHGEPLRAVATPGGRPGAALPGQPVRGRPRLRAAPMPPPLALGIVCFPSLGGSGVVASERALGLARRGHRIHLIASSHPSRQLPPCAGETFHEVRHELS